MPNKIKWLELSEAANYLGVHFSTLRRWADNGKIRCMRTPGGRRRFRSQDLENFITSGQQEQTKILSVQWKDQLILSSRQQIEQRNPQSELWMNQLTLEQRDYFRNSGNRLMALLMQYASRTENGDYFIEESKRITMEYGQICYQVGMSIAQSVQAFLFFQRSILDSVHETGVMSGLSDQENITLYQRTSHFFDVLILSMINHFENLSRQV